jgi:hypothetical protein
MNKSKAEQGTNNLLGPSTQLYELIRLFLILAGFLITSVWILKSYASASRWIVTAILFYFFAISLLKRTSKKSSGIKLFTYLLSVFFVLVLIWHTAHIGYTTEAVRIRTTIFINLVFIFLTYIGLRISNIGISRDTLILFFVPFLLITSLVTTRNMKTIFSSFTGIPIFQVVQQIVIDLLILYMIVTFLDIKKYTGQLQSRKKLLVLFLSINLYLAFRVDSINSLPGSYYHFGYFSDVVKTLKGGGTLLWDTPSQYGFLNLLLFSQGGIEPARQAVYIWQSVFMFLTVSFVLYYIYVKTKGTKKFPIFSALFLLIFYFSDPDLIGPQPYPSSSAVRFGPSIIYVLSLVLLSKKIMGNVKYLSLTVFGFTALNFLWSAESFLYSIIISIFLVFTLMTDRTIKNRFLIFSLLATSVTAAVFTGFALMSLYTLTRVGNFPDLSMHFMYALGYSQGYGSLPLQIATPAWISLMVFVICIYGIKRFTSSFDSEKRLNFAVLAGALFAWSTYYLGRAHQDNLMAEFPLLILICFVVLLEYQNSKDEHKNSFSALFVWIFTALLVGLISISNVGQIAFIERLLTMQSLGSIQTVSPVVADSDLTSLLQSSAVNDDLPVVYQGWDAITPSLDSVVGKNFNEEEVWLPMPLTLLEEPISADKQKTVLDRYADLDFSGGILVRHLERSFPARHETLMRNLQGNYSCSVSAKNEVYKIYECLKK